jgi:hypothetical protein
MSARCRARNEIAYQVVQPGRILYLPISAKSLQTFEKLMCDLYISRSYLLPIAQEHGSAASFPRDATPERHQAPKARRCPATRGHKITTHPLEGPEVRGNNTTQSVMNRAQITLVSNGERT